MIFEKFSVGVSPRLFKRYGVLFTLVLLGNTARATNLSGFFTDSDQFLKKWTMHGKVNYEGVKSNFAQIEHLYTQINQMDLEGASQEEKKAFYINAYNLIVIYQVAKYYPLKSPMNHSGFFDKVKHQVAGEVITLNFLEIKRLLFPYRDPRIHFALACAARSCPALASFAYLPDALEQQLEDRTALAVNDPTFIRIQQETIALSKIFDWYERDFTQDGQTVFQFINRYRTHKLPQGRGLTYYDYDWQLNDL